MKLWHKVALVAGGTAVTLLLLRSIARGDSDVPLTARNGRHPRVTGPRTVLALGDSLTGTPGYCRAILDGLDEGSSVKCAGYVGEGAQVIAGKLKQARQMGATDVVILAGVNDLATGRNLNVIKSWLGTMYSQAAAQGMRVVAVTLTPWMGHHKGPKNQERWDELNAWIHAHPSPAAVVDTAELGDFMGNLSYEYDAGDGLHLNKRGARALGELVLREGF